MTHTTAVFGITKNTLFQLLKYGIYLLILYNVIYFIYEDYMSSEHRFRDGVSWSQFTDAFAQAVDSIAWLILLLMFELETWVIDDKKYRGSVKWSVNGISGACYVLIFLAFLGYTEKLNFVLQFNSSDIAVACDAVGTYLSYAVDIDEFIALSATSCSEVGSAPYFANNDANIIANNSVYTDMVLLGYTEVINAAAWLLIVVLLWIDVYHQLRRQQSDQYHRISTWVKVVLYGILIVAAILWGLYGNFIDFWDAFLWIIAFFFIELNIFQWNEEIAEEDALSIKTGATGTLS